MSKIGKPPSPDRSDAEPEDDGRAEATPVEIELGPNPLSPDDERKLRLMDGLFPAARSD